MFRAALLVTNAVGCGPSHRLMGLRANLSRVSFSPRGSDFLLLPCEPTCLITQQILYNIPLENTEHQCCIPLLLL